MLHPDLSYSFPHPYILTILFQLFNFVLTFNKIWFADPGPRSLIDDSVPGWAQGRVPKEKQFLVQVVF